MAKKLKYRSLVSDRFVVFFFIESEQDINYEDISCTFRLSVDEANLFEPLRPKTLEINLLASSQQTFFDLLPNQEQDVLIVVNEVNVGTYFRGFVLADGFVQDYTNEVWNTTIKASCGLLLLNNYEFIVEQQYSTVIYILDKCLKKTGVDLELWTPLEGGALSQTLPKVVVNEDPLLYTSYFSSFINERNFEGKSASEVLEQLLGVVNCYVVQENNRWYLIRPYDLIKFKNKSVLFSRYKDGIFNGIQEENINVKIGSEINNSTIFWCNKNQIIEGRPSLGGNRAVYDLGDAIPQIDNFDLINNGVTITDWSIINTSFLTLHNETSVRAVIEIDTSDRGSGFILPNDYLILLTSDNINVFAGDVAKVKTSYYTESRTAANWIITLTTSTETYYLSQSGWQTSYVNFWVRKLHNPESFIEEEFEIEAFPNTGVLNINVASPIFYVAPNPIGGVESRSVIIDKIEVQLEDTSGVLGVEYSGRRILKPSSVIEENINYTISNRNQTNLTYLGTLVDGQFNPLPREWKNQFFSGIDIIALNLEERLRSQYLVSLIFSGDIYGDLHYHSLVEIDGFNDRYFLISSSEFNTVENTSYLVLKEITKGESADIEIQSVTKKKESENIKV